MDATRLAAIFRAVRFRKGWRQADVARAARISDDTVAKAEGPRITGLRLETILRIAAALDIRVDIYPRWRGGDLDRMLNAGHSAMHEQVARLLSDAPDWLFKPEVSFAIYGERGVIDVLAFHPPSGALLVIELKTELVDVQDLIGKVDRYVRLAAQIAKQQGWRATTVSCWVILREGATNRRRLATHASTLHAAFPVDGRTIRGWLRDPGPRVRAFSFLPTEGPGAAAGGGGVRRVRRRVRSAA